MVPVLAIFCIFGLPVVAYIINKMLAHNERMELIRMGYFSGGYQPALPPLRSAAPGATITPFRTVLEMNRRES